MHNVVSKNEKNKTFILFQNQETITFRKFQLKKIIKVNVIHFFIKKNIYHL